MDRLWAPWRINYIRQKKARVCLFCRAKDYVVIRNKHSLSMLNTFPYNNGHMMVAPIRHIRDLGQLNKEEILDLFTTLKETKNLLDKTIKPQGYNLGINLGRIAGAGIVGHLHIHIVPRWSGDTNFMPAIYNTKVISQSLNELYLILKNVKSKSNKRIRR